MDTNLKSDWTVIKESFDLSCDLRHIAPIGSGHINETYHLVDDDKHWVLQHVNSNVFPNPQIVQQNFDRIAKHLKLTDYPLEILTIKRTKNDHSLALANGRSWRLMKLIPNCKVLDTAEHGQDAYNAANAVGHFNNALSNLPCSEITPVINGFHDLQLRLNQFNQSLLKNHNNRVSLCKNELEVIKKFAKLADWIPKAKANQLINQRVVHNDTKISNILISNTTGLAKAVIDWDTVMPGYCFYDYGDMVRSFVPAGGEDQPENSELRWDVLQALTEGYLSSCADSLLPFEKENLLVGAEIIIFMIGVRFLSDYFNGDIYFRVSRENQNLDRAKTQFALLEQLHSNYSNWQQQLGLVSQTKTA
ncbi:MAG: aminoglycoside phosphotransferase family protein [Kangiellaceae bacterium]|nr:aminoglycoside phosphotransferase family protein [Kangiellaceae bacterium]MCW9017749.1 aminoglycoside phosphotransferase family protein [Kangiellaceae bacterium]